ncbi:MAG: hypothetical protein QW587_02240 [Candidatus Bathyarchaeia archaeon]
MPHLRDRDAIVTEEGLIFRVYGYWHPSEGYVCDPEYAPSTLYRSANPRAVRQSREGVYYKFFEHDGLNFIEENFPKYRVYCKPLHKSLVGVKEADIGRVRLPVERLTELLDAAQPKDSLVKKAEKVVSAVLERTSLKASDLGVFGSLLHSFHHPDYSDLDFVVVGAKAQLELREALADFYREGSLLANEFDRKVAGKTWRFQNFTFDEYVTHQRRKGIYGVLLGSDGERDVKVEFEPVRGYDEVVNEYLTEMEVSPLGLVSAEVKVLDDAEAFYMPSIYPVEVERVIRGPEAAGVERIVSYVEEFRGQVFTDELARVQGMLEQVTTPSRSYKQITLTYGPYYYAQVLARL